jgi:hypothetical protein
MELDILQFENAEPANESTRSSPVKELFTQGPPSRSATDPAPQPNRGTLQRKAPVEETAEAEAEAESTPDQLQALLVQLQSVKQLSGSEGTPSEVQLQIIDKMQQQLQSLASQLGQTSPKPDESSLPSPNSQSSSSSTSSSGHRGHERRPSSLKVAAEEEGSQTARY